MQQKFLDLLPRSNQVARVGVLIGATIALSSCALVNTAKPGTPLTEVIAKFGPPSTDCPNPDGTRHLVWSQQPMAETAMGTTVSKDGTIGEVVQVLNDANFNRLGTGEWSQERVRCEFGPPAEQGKIGIAEKRSYVWSYRYRQQNVWYSLMYVYFDLDTKLVTHFNPGPDPLFEAIGGSRR